MKTFAASRCLEPYFIFKKLEEIKNQGGGGLEMLYGESAGVDDSDVDPIYRNVVLRWTPCGSAPNAVRVEWHGKLGELNTFDFSVFPSILSPEEAAVLAPDKPGLFIFGDLKSIAVYVNRGSLDFRQWCRNSE